MNFLIAPNALKGSLSALRAADTISQTLKRITPDVATFLCPIADGGDGTLDCLVQACNGKIFTANVRGPIFPLRVNARWGILGDGATAVIEMAEAAGLRLLTPTQYDVGNTSTYGVGELIFQAVHSGSKKIIVGLGGSATNDGGAGCARALGVRFLDEHSRELPEGGIHLGRLHHWEIKNYELGIKDLEIIGLADVSNTLCGPEGAAYTFAAQKGASNELVAQLDAGMQNYASIIERETYHKVLDSPGSGAAGGLGAGLMAFCNATIVSGIDFVLDAMQFDSLLERCECVITTEGKIDSQTLQGKGVQGIARRAQKFGKPVHAFVGQIDGDGAELQKILGLASLHQISPNEVPIEEAMRQAESFLAVSIRDFFTSNIIREAKK